MDPGRTWQLFSATAVWLVLHLGGAYAFWWCLVWRADPPAWIVAGALLLLSWAGTDIGYRLVWTESMVIPPRAARYLLAAGGALAVQPYSGAGGDETLEWQRRWFVPLALAGFIIPLLLLGWQGLFAAGFVRFHVHRYGLPALATAGRVALDRIGRRLSRHIPCPDVTRLMVRAMLWAARAMRKVIPTTA